MSDDQQLDDVDVADEVRTEAPETTVPQASPRKPQRGRWWLIGAAALTVIALVGAAFVAGWLVASRAVAAAEHTPDDTMEAPISNLFSDEALMPDVRGMSEAAALQAIADAGIPVSAVEVTTRPTAGSAGVVIEQDPAFGVPSPEDVGVVVSSPAAVPDLVGAFEADAAAELAVLGAAVNRADRYDPDQPVGMVLGIEPAPGSDLPEAVTLTVNVAPSSVGLADVDWTGQCSSSSNATISGTKYDGAVICPSQSRNPKPGAWLLSGAVDGVVGSIGILDTEPTGTTASVQLIVDGAPAATYNVVWGAAQQIDLRTTGALKLEVIVTGGSTSVDVGFGGVLLQGEPSSIAKIRRN